MLKSLKQVRAALSLMRPDEVRRLSSQPVHIGLVAATRSGYADMEHFLIINGAPRHQVHRADDGDVPSKVDFVLYEYGLNPPEGGYTFDPRDPETCIAEILHDNDELALPLAKQFPAFRAPVINRLVHEIARENALFAFATAIPNIVPNLTELPWAFGEFASDTAFLTTNQVRMAFMIAAASGREAGFSKQVGPILSIAGGAFGWRALARELVGKIPLGGGLIPKGAVAYAGTYVAGKALERFYGGHAPFSRAERETVYQQAYRRGKGVVGSEQRNPA
jgi:hypothetical protein